MGKTDMKRSHWKVIFTAGMGFFTDAYDLFIFLSDMTNRSLSETENILVG